MIFIGACNDLLGRSADRSLASGAVPVGVPGAPLWGRADQVADAPGDGCAPFSGGVATRSVSPINAILVLEASGF